MIQLRTYFGVCVSEFRGDEQETERQGGKEENEFVQRKGSKGSGSAVSLEQELPHTKKHEKDTQKHQTSRGNILDFSHTGQQEK